VGIGAIEASGGGTTKGAKTRAGQIERQIKIRSYSNFGWWPPFVCFASFVVFHRLESPTASPKKPAILSRFIGCCGRAEADRKIADRKMRRETDSDWYFSVIHVPVSIPADRALLPQIQELSQHQAAAIKRENLKTFRE